MRRAVLAALLLAAGAALAQNPFRDLATDAPPPAQQDPQRPTPITIDIPASQLPPPPLNVPALPEVPTADASEEVAPPTLRVVLPNDVPVFALPALTATPYTPTRHAVTLANPVYTTAPPPATPLLAPLMLSLNPTTPEVTNDASPRDTQLTGHAGVGGPEGLAAEPEAAVEEDPRDRAWCEDAAALATTAGEHPTALVRCHDETLIARVGDRLPGGATIAAIDAAGVTVERDGAAYRLPLAFE